MKMTTTNCQILNKVGSLLTGVKIHLSFKLTPLNTFFYAYMGHTTSSLFFMLFQLYFSFFLYYIDGTNFMQTKTATPSLSLNFYSLIIIIKDHRRNHILERLAIKELLYNYLEFKTKFIFSKEAMSVKIKKYSLIFSVKPGICFH